MKNKLTLIALLGLFLAGTYTVYAQDEEEYVPPTTENEYATDDDINWEEGADVAAEEAPGKLGWTQKIKTSFF